MAIAVAAANVAAAPTPDLSLFRPAGAGLSHARTLHGLRLSNVRRVRDDSNRAMNSLAELATQCTQLYDQPRTSAFEVTAHVHTWLTCNHPYSNAPYRTLCTCRGPGLRGYITLCIQQESGDDSAMKGGWRCLPVHTPDARTTRNSQSAGSGHHRTPSSSFYLWRPTVPLT